MSESNGYESVKNKRPIFILVSIVVFVIVTLAFTSSNVLIPRLIGAVIFGYGFGEGLWRGLATEKLGKFNRTSQIVWGTVLIIFVCLFAFMYYMIHSNQ